MTSVFFLIDRDCKQTPLTCGKCDKSTGKKQCSRKILVTPIANGKKCLPENEEKDCRMFFSDFF